MINGPPVKGPPVINIHAKSKPESQAPGAACLAVLSLYKYVNYCRTYEKAVSGGKRERFELEDTCVTTFPPLLFGADLDVTVITGEPQSIYLSMLYIYIHAYNI